MLTIDGGRNGFSPIPNTSSVFVTCGLFLELEDATSFRMVDLKRETNTHG